MNDSVYRPNGSFYFESNSTNISNQLKSDWGPKRDPLYIVFPISVIYISIFISGVLGNISTCIVIARNKCLHTATNYYLFSLAISDLLLLTSGLPPEIYAIWSRYPYIFGEEFCVLQGFAAEASANATVLTITAFTIERYVAICYPFLSHTLSNLNRAIKYIIYIWLFAISLAIPQALAFGIVCEIVNGHKVDEHCVCIPKRNVIPHAFEISTFVFFIAPMSLITVLYVLIGVQLHKSLKPRHDDSVKMRHRVYKHVVNFGVNNVINEDVKGLHYRNGMEEEGRKIYAKNACAAKHVVKMLVAVVIAFFICWAPFHAQRLFAIYASPTSRPMITSFQVLTYISGVFYYLSTTINPLLYHIMSHKFREAFKVTYKQCCKKRQRLPGGKCYSSLSARSSQVNSHSTDSQIQSTLRYLEEEMAQLHQNKRPLVVSFRRKKYSPNYKSGIGETFRNNSRSRCNADDHAICDSNIHMIFDSPQEKNRSRSDMYGYNSDIQVDLHFLRNGQGYDSCSRFKPSSSNLDTVRFEEKTDEIGVLSNCQKDFDRMEYLEMEQKCSFMEVQSLQPTHICPLNRNVEFL